MKAIEIRHCVATYLKPRVGRVLFARRALFEVDVLAIVIEMF